MRLTKQLLKKITIKVALKTKKPNQTTIKIEPIVHKFFT